MAANIFCTRVRLSGASCGFCRSVSFHTGGAGSVTGIDGIIDTAALASFKRDEDDGDGNFHRDRRREHREAPGAETAGSLRAVDPGYCDSRECAGVVAGPCLWRPRSALGYV